MLSRIQISLIAVVFCCGLGNRAFAVGVRRVQASPGDLQLSAAEVAQSEALSHFAWGFFLQMDGRGDATDFQKQYLDALRQAPDSGIILEQLVTPWVVERNFAKIVETITPIAQENPGNPQLQVVLTQALLAQNKTSDAIAHLEEALRKGKSFDPMLFRELFTCYWREKRYDDAKGLLRRSRKKPELRGHFSVEHAAAVFYNAMAYRPDAELTPRGQKRLARRSLKHARKAVARIAQAERPVDVESLAELLVTLEAWEDLVDLLQAARTVTRFASPTLDLLLAQGLNRLGKPEEMLAVLQSVTQYDGLQPNLYPEIARLYLVAEEPELARMFYERALLSFPRSPQIRFKLAYLYFQLKQPEKTIAVLRKIPKLPAEGHLLVSHACRVLKRNEEAAKAIAKAEEAALKAGNQAFFSVDFYLFYATFCEEQGHTERSLEKVRKALKLDPSDPVGANFLGYVLADHDRDLAEAEKWVKIALAADAENFAYLDSLAWVYYRQKRFPQALTEINQALRLSGSKPDPVILDHAGDICAANKLWLLARKYWLDALAVGGAEAERITQKIEQIPDATEAGKE